MNKTELTYQKFLKIPKIIWITKRCRHGQGGAGKYYDKSRCKFAPMAGFLSDSYCPEHYYQKFIGKEGE